MNLLTIAHENTKRYLENIIDYDWSDEALDNRVEKGLEIEFCSEMIKKRNLAWTEILPSLYLILLLKKKNGN